MKYNKKTLRNVKVLDVTLLTKEEVEKYNELIDPVNAPWWLSSEEPNNAYFVYHSIDEFGFICSYLRNGDLHNCDKVWSSKMLRKKYGVRPAFRLSNLEKNGIKPGDIIKFYQYDFRVLSSDLAICADYVDKKPYRKDFEAENAWDYESSDVKRYLKVWYEKYKWLDDNCSKIEKARKKFQKEEHPEFKHFTHIYGEILDEVGKKSFKVKNCYDSGRGEVTVGFHEVVDVKDLYSVIWKVMSNIKEESFRSENKELFEDAKELLESTEKIDP